jgi:hypothetical protein
VVVLLMAWQAVGAAASPLVPLAHDSSGHFALHWLESAHHHHDDGSVHDEPSPESQSHAALDLLGSACALVCDAMAHRGQRASHDVLAIDGAAWTSPPSDGPFRPPRLTS